MCASTIFGNWSSSDVVKFIFLRSHQYVEGGNSFMLNKNRFFVRQILFSLWCRLCYCTWFSSQFPDKGKRKEKQVCIYRGTFHKQMPDVFPHTLHFACKTLADIVHSGLQPGRDVTPGKTRIYCCSLLWVLDESESESLTLSDLSKKT